MARLGAWIQAARPLAQGNMAPPILLGQGLAMAGGASFDWALAGAAYGFGIADHLFIVFANDYADREGDRENRTPTPFSGGSRVLVDGLIAPTVLRRAAQLAAAALLVGSAAVAVIAARPLFVLFAALAIGLLYAYSYPPLRLSHRGGGEWLQGVGVGGVLVVVGYYSLEPELTSFPAIVLPVTIGLAVAGNITTALPDLDSDRREGKRTLVVRWGEPGARLISGVIIAIAAFGVSIVSPPCSRVTLAVVAMCVLAIVAKNLTDFRSTVLRFVVINGAAMSVLWIGWAVLLMVAR